MTRLALAFGLLAITATAQARDESDRDVQRESVQLEQLDRKQERPRFDDLDRCDLEQEEQNKADHKWYLIDLARVFHQGCS